MGNYHYYLKQEILCGHSDSIDAKNQKPVFSWHVEKPLRFAAAVAGKFHRSPFFRNPRHLTVARQGYCE
jgi:hypothetical protein